MTIKKPLKTPAEPARDPLLEAPIPHAYALVPHPTRQGVFFAVHLEGVLADRLEHLEPNGSASQAVFGLNRIGQAMETRHRGKKWGRA